MALTTTQVNQAFLATLGRPAEGSAATWGSTSLSLDTLLDSIFIAENTDGDFVEYLYQNILGRASDAEGKAFWNSLLATTSKEAVLAQFKAAVIAAGQADPSNADYQSFIAQNKAFVTELYTNLLGRTDAASADAEGVEFWANALASGTSKGALLAQFTAAALSDPNSDDAQTLNAKVNVANAITAKFNNFNADVTADQKKAALDALKATMTEVVAGSTAEDFQERIDTFAGNYQNRVAQVFTKPTDDKPTDSLDSSEATASTVFSGNVNLINPENGTIQRGDSVAGNSNYTDTLRVSVTSDSANKEFDLDTYLPGTVSSVEKLIITAGAANVNGTLDGTNYAESTTITSTGDVDLKIRGVQKELKVTAGDKKDAAITVESGSLDNYTGSAAKDTIIVNAGSVKTIDTGAGKDTVEIKGTDSIQSEGSIKLGAGDDELTIGATLQLDKEKLNKISLDGGEGSKDKLTISTDITAVNSITGFETITTTGTSAKISADAANSLTSGTKLSNGSDLKIDMVDKNSLNLKNLKVGNDADNKLGKATVDVLNVAKGEITLTSTTKNAIVETITLAKTTTDGKTGTVTIKGIGAAELEGEGKKSSTFGDKLKIAETTIGENPIKLQASVAAGKTQTLAADKLYYVNTKISSADELASKGTVLDLKLSLATGSKALVALNNSAQNKSYIYEITGSATLTRDNITLKAIVDNAINKYDQVSGNTIEFVAGVEKDVSGGASTDPVITDALTYDSGATTLELKATDGKGTYNSVKFDAPLKSGEMLVISDVKSTGNQGLAVKDTGSLSDANSTVAAVVTGALGTGTITKNTTDAEFKGTLDVYLGGYVDNNVIKVGSANVAKSAATLGVDSIKGADSLIANTTGTIFLDDANKLATANKTIELKGLGTTIDLSATAYSGATTLDINNFVSGANSNDTVIVKGHTNVNTVKGAATNDKVTLATNNTDSVIKVTLGAGNDQLSAKDQKISGVGTALKGIIEFDANSGDSIILAANNGVKQVVSTDIKFTTSLENTLKAGLTVAAAGASTDAVLVKVYGATGNNVSNNATYLIFGGSQTSLEDNDIVVKLVGNSTNVSVFDDGTAFSGVNFA
ncbi:DUF4214 domain-containing protein [Campylobacter sp. 46490-21]|uniref:beta strand repeat-containing protein n=1 Tax=Campylobacter magnus TaxID=3026462 RepID=UPI0023602FF1|nr:DUF4214 domain-containing protein [Campylobacter magnus]MDD0847317.1 DUF4214 domain-containing protein [Campylobacter magnus]